MQPRVLMVDDDLHIRTFITANLEARGYNVSQAFDGAAALLMIENQPFDIIILDIMMPGLDGFKVCKLVRESYDIPILMLSARQDVLDKAKCFELGANDYMTKPFSLKEFLARIETLLRRSALNREKVQSNPDTIQVHSS